MKRKTHPIFELLFASCLPLLLTAALDEPFRWASLASFGVAGVFIVIARFGSERLKTIVFTTAVLLTLGAFLTMAVFGAEVGGSASLGKIEGDAYFLGGSGEFTEVSELTYRLAMVPELFFLSFMPALAILMTVVELWEARAGRL